MTKEPPSARDIILEALASLGEARPSDIMDWYEAQTGTAPPQDPGTFRTTISRMGKSGDLSSVPGRYGYYTIPRVDCAEQSAAAASLALTGPDDWEGEPPEAPLASGVLFEIRGPQGVIYRLTIQAEQVGEPLRTYARAAETV